MDSRAVTYTLQSERHKMARTPNFKFDRMERDRAKALKTAEKAKNKLEKAEAAKAQDAPAEPKED